MADTTRNLIIKLTSHMAYMQGQLEAHHELDDLEDYYWYRESVALRQQVADALATDEPAVPEGREPAPVTGEPSDEELLKVAGQAAHIDDILDALEEGYPLELTPVDIVDICRAVIARWGNQPAPPAEGEVGELVAKLRRLAPQNPLGTADPTITRAADLLERLASPACLVVNPPPEAVQALEAAGPGRIELMPADPPQPVPVSERLPGVLCRRRT